MTQQHATGIRFPRLYDLLISLTTRGHAKHYYNRLSELADIQPGQHVLDVGCGTGKFAVEAWRRCQRGGSAQGVDVSSEMLQVARSYCARAGAPVTLLQGSATALPFPDKHMDVVTMITVMHAIPLDAQHACLREIVRVLRPGGHFLLVDFAGEEDERRHWISRHGAHRAFDLRAFGEALNDAGLRPGASGAVGWMDLGYVVSKTDAYR